MNDLVRECGVTKNQISALSFGYEGAGLHAVCLINQAQGLYAACRNTDDRAATLIELREQEAPMPTN